MIKGNGGNMAHGDKRSVSTDALETLGTIIGPGQGRDAIHLAVEPVEAAIDLYPGQDVGLVDGKAGVTDDPVGIVDPFLRNKVLKGERFWLVVYPRQIASLRHVWTHPKFPDPDQPALAAVLEPPRESQRFIREAAREIGVDSADLLERLKDYLDDRDSGESENGICFGDEIDSWELPEGFWLHYEAVTGRKVPEKFREVYFRCAC